MTTLDEPLAVSTVVFGVDIENPALTWSFIRDELGRDAPWSGVRSDGWLTFGNEWSQVIGKARNLVVAVAPPF